MLLPALLLLAQDVPCPPLDTSRLGPFAGWMVHAESLEPGTAVTMTTGEPAAGGRKAMVAFAIRVAGPYEIAIDQPGGLELFRGFDDGEPIAATGRRQDGPCSPLREIVRFDLRPGAYRLYLSGLGRPRVRVMLVPGE